MTRPVDVNLWPSAEHSLEYLQRADLIPHRGEGEAALLEFLPAKVTRVLDVGSGGGRLLAMVKGTRPGVECVALDFSPTMLQVLRENFGDEVGTTVVEQDFSRMLPDLGSFDAVVSSFAIHHVPDERKRALFEEIYGLLNPGGVFLNLEHV